LAPLLSFLLLLDTLADQKRERKGRILILSSSFQNAQSTTKYLTTINLQQQTLNCNWKVMIGFAEVFADIIFH
jgi:hypothetical protein